MEFFESAMQIRTVFLSLSVIVFLSMNHGCRSDEDQDYPQELLSGWVGSEACAGCHQPFYDQYVKTGMGRSFPPLDVRVLASTVKFEQPVYEASTGFNYIAFIRDSQLVMREYRVEGGRITFQQERVATYQIGSANHTISFIEQQGGYLFEMPLTWYALKKMWDMSPGYKGNNQRFERPINNTCMNCHNGPSLRALSTENYFEHLKQGIGCENCHGPGKRHVAAANQSPSDKNFVRSTIKNSAGWERELQMDLCQRCHLEGLSVWNDGIEPYMVEPGKPLSLYKAVFVSKDSYESKTRFNIAAQADRLRKSICFVKSGSMTCTTCHEPHSTSSTMQREYFNKTCFSCHRGDGHSLVCSVSHTIAERTNDCVSCHMGVGETNDIPHVSFTDHYIRRRPEFADEPTTETTKVLVPIIHSTDHGTQLQQRGLAYLEFYLSEDQDVAYLDSTIVLLNDARRLGATRRDGEDEYALGVSLSLRNRFPEAESALRRAIEKNPLHARAMYSLGTVLSRQGKTRQSVESFRKGIMAQSRLVENYVGLGYGLLVSGEPGEAAKMLQRGLEQDSLSFPDLHLYLAQAYLQMGNVIEASRKFSDVLKTHPTHEAAMMGLVEVSFRKKDWTRVLTYCDSILSRNPMHIPALLSKSVALRSTGREKAAKETAKSVLMIDPSNVVARSYLRSD